VTEALDELVDTATGGRPRVPRGRKKAAAKKAPARKPPAGKAPADGVSGES
jgi:hypothetical protein